MIIRIIDTETCGFPPDNNQVVEVATIDLVSSPDMKTWTRGRMWSSLINPGRAIPPEASGIHHITDDMVKDAPIIGEVIDKILAPDADQAPSHFAAHEAKFDRASLPFMADRIDICTRKCAVTAWPDASNHRNQTLRYYLKLKLADPSLAEPHRALGDCYVTGGIMRRLLSIPVTIGDWAAISAGPVLLPRFYFGEHAMKPIKDVPISYMEWILNKAKFDDEDVVHTARTYLTAHRETQRNRSPV